MDYCNKESIETTRKSYTEALDKLLELCPKVEPSANESNWRVVAPTTWRPVFSVKRDDLLRHINYLNTHYESLFEFDRPQIINERWTMWRDRFFSVSCSIKFPFNIYTWEIAQQLCPGGFDDEGNCIGGYVNVPTKMVEWCSPQYLTLEVYDSTWGKAWGLKDWHIKYNEIANFGKVFEHVGTQARYMDGLKKASEEVAKWETAIAQLQNLAIPR